MTVCGWMLTSDIRQCFWHCPSNIGDFLSSILKRTRSIVDICTLVRRGELCVNEVFIDSSYVFGYLVRRNGDRVSNDFVCLQLNRRACKSRQVIGENQALAVNHMLRLWAQASIERPLFTMRRLGCVLFEVAYPWFSMRYKNESGTRIGLTNSPNLRLSRTSKTQLDMLCICLLRRETQIRSGQWSCLRSPAGLDSASYVGHEEKSSGLMEIEHMLVSADTNLALRGERSARNRVR